MMPGKCWMRRQRARLGAACTAGKGRAGPMPCTQLQVPGAVPGRAEGKSGHAAMRLTSAPEGWMPMVLSSWRLVTPIFTATPMPCMISAESGPTCGSKEAGHAGHAGHAGQAAGPHGRARHDLARPRA